MATLQVKTRSGAKTRQHEDTVQKLRASLDGELIRHGDRQYDEVREGDARIRAAYGKNYERLVEIKTEWGPGNLLRMNKNIAPRVA